jgi:phospholipase/carboxylesterase
MLERTVMLPDAPVDGAPLIVLLHGRGSHMGDLASLRPHLPADAIVVTLQAPFPGAPWGYGGGWAWYLFMGGTRPEPESFLKGQAALEETLRALPTELPVRPGARILAGFSQGSTSALALALRRRDLVDAVVMFSGFVADHPEVRASAAAGLPVFWSHGVLDMMISHQTADAGRAALAAGGAAVMTHDFRGGHTIDSDGLRQAVEWMQMVRGGVSA